MKRLLTVLLLAGFAVACGDDDEDPKGNGSTDSGVDAGRDGSTPPATDAGPRAIKVSNAGGPCTTAAQCMGTAPSCDTKTALGGELPGGYCSATCLFNDECGTSGDCPLGELVRTLPASATMGQTAGSCYKKCTPNTSGDCREGYVCSSLSAALNIPPNPIAPALSRNVCLPIPSRDGGVPSTTDGGVDGGMRDGG